MTVHDREGNVRFCGRADNEINELQSWPHEHTISYGVLADTLTSKVPTHEQITDLSTALRTWQAACDLQLDPLEEAYPTESVTDITLAYREGAHGDGNPFDDAGGVVGHAWFPPDGRIHHDNSETWTPSYRQRVTQHEVGHALGLGHAPTLGNVMYPYVTEQLHLGPWDVRQIQARYGAVPDDPKGPEIPSIPPPPMLVGVRRDEIYLDDNTIPVALMVKMYVHDSSGPPSRPPLAESAYFEDGFFMFEIPQCQQWSIQMRSPVKTKFEGPFPWVGGRLEWLTNLSFTTDEPDPDDPEEPEGPEDPRWLPWRQAEMVATADGLQIRFLDTRTRDEIEALLTHDLGQILAHRLHEAGVPMDGILDGTAVPARASIYEFAIPDEDGGL